MSAMHHARRTAAGALTVVAMTVAVTAAVLLPTAEASAKPKPQPTATATASPSPSPSPSPSSTPSASPSPSPTATATVSPTATAEATAPACTDTVTIDGALWCTATDRDIVYGSFPAGTAVFVSALALEMWGRDGYIYVAPDCPEFCGAIVDSARISFPNDPLPPTDVLVDIWGHTTADGMTAVGFRPL